MFGSKDQKAEPGLRRLQQDISRDRLRLQQRLELIDDDQPVADAPRTGNSGRLYEVFVAMGEA